MLKKSFIGVLVMVTTIQATQVVQIDRIRGEYELNFSNVYEIPIYPDIETMIALPPGYKITLAMPGSPDFVSASVIQNTIYLTCPVDHRVETNVAVHVITPEGLEEKLMIRCVGPVKGTKVLAVQFTQPNTSEVNRIVESMKARYTEQLSAELSNQEKSLNRSIHNQTITDAHYFFIHSSRKKINKEYKGAKVFLDGIISSRDNTFIYLLSTVKNGDCNIISLDKITLGNRSLTPELISVRQLSDNEYYYCWSIPQIQIPKKTMRIKFDLKIWSKTQTISAKIS